MPSPSFKYSCALHKFHKAVRTLIGLANTQDTLQERLDVARSIYLLVLLPEQIPDKLQNDFKEIRELVVKNLSNQEINRLTEKITLMYEYLSQLKGAYYQSMNLPPEYIDEET